METDMTNEPKAGKPRILKDLSSEVLLAILKERGDLPSATATKEEKVFVGDYTPKKGRDAGKTVRRLFVQGNFYPLVIGQETCRVMAENIAVIEKFGKTGK